MQAVKGLKGGRAGGPSGRRSEDLKFWLWEASRKKNTLRRQCRMLVNLIQRTFKDGVLSKEVAWSNIFFSQKLVGGIRG